MGISEMIQPKFTDMSSIFSRYLYHILLQLLLKQL